MGGSVLPVTASDNPTLFTGIAIGLVVPVFEETGRTWFVIPEFRQLRRQRARILRLKSTASAIVEPGSVTAHSDAPQISGWQ